MASEADLLIEAGFSDAKLARESQKVIDMFKTTGTKAEKVFQSAVDSVSGSQKIKASARELDKLKREFDPLYAASKRYEAQVNRLDRAHQAGAVSTKQHAAALDRLNAEFAGGTGQVETATRRFGGSLQQVGFQVGDFATQVGAGTSATQALGQQLPQLLGAFGTFGALAGAGAAILIPLGAALVKTAFDSASLEDRMKGLGEATDAMVDAAERAAQPISALRTEYGDLADEVARANGAMAAFTAAQAGAALRGAAGATAALFPDATTPRRVYGMSDAEWLEVTEEQMRRLMKATGASREQAEELRMALNRLETANGPEAVYRDAEKLLGVMAQLPGSTERLAEQFTTVDKLMQQALKQMEAQRAEVVRLRDEYDATTTKMRDLAADLSRAEAERAKASADGKADEVAAWDRVIEKIRETIYETREAAKATDTLFERMSKAAQGYLDTAGKAVSSYMSDDGFAGRYIAARTRGAGSRDEELVRATAAAAEQLGIATKDLLSIIMLESGGSPSIRGGAGNRHIGLIQFGPEEQKKYGAAIGQTITEQMAAVVAYLKDRGVKPGMALPNVYAAVNAGQAHLTNRGDTRNGGIVDNIYDFTTGPKMQPYLNRADGLLAAYPDVIEEVNEGIRETKRLEDESAAAVKREVKERERKAEALDKARTALSESLISQQKAADLEAQRAAKLAEINKGAGSDAEKAAAIAQVNAETERQITIMALLEEAKRRQVDLDALMVGSTLTYRQAIEALGEARKDSIITAQQEAAEMERLSERHEFMAQQQRAFEDGLVDAIIAGESFTDVLANIAQALAKAALQAALFGTGPFGNAQGTGGLLSGLSSLIFGKRALGGPVDPDRAYLVGERGPEIIVPRAPGQVIPNHKIGVGGGGSMSMVIDLRGTTGDAVLDEKMRAAGARILAQARAQAPGWISEHDKRFT